MIQKALEYIVGMRKPEILRVDGQEYSDKPLNRISYNPKADAIKMSTLSSLIEYISEQIDDMQGKMIIHVQSPTHIEMYSQLDGERKRECVVEVDAQVPEFRFGQYMEHEPFCINLQAKFIDEPGTDRALLLKFAGTVEAGTVAEYGDDGVTQKATIKTGIATKEAAIVPNPVVLKPFRTFVEVQQPISQFIFRMKQDKYDGIQCALFEADGGAWKLQAMEGIKRYLKENLAGLNNDFIVIS